MSISSTRTVIADALAAISDTHIATYDVSGSQVGRTIEILGPTSMDYSESVSGKRFQYTLSAVASVPATGAVGTAQGILDDLVDPTNASSVYRLLHAVSVAAPLTMLRVTRCERPITPDNEGRWVAIIDIQCVEVYT